MRTTMHCVAARYSKMSTMRIRGATVGPVEVARRRCHEKSALIPSLTNFHIGRRRRQRAARCLHMRDSLPRIPCNTFETIDRTTSFRNPRRGRFDQFLSYSSLPNVTTSDSMVGSLNDYSNRIPPDFTAKNKAIRLRSARSLDASRPLESAWSRRGRDTGSRDFVRSTR